MDDFICTDPARWQPPAFVAELRQMMDRICDHKKEAVDLIVVWPSEWERLKAELHISEHVKPTSAVHDRFCGIALFVGETDMECLERRMMALMDGKRVMSVRPDGVGVSYYGPPAWLDITRVEFW